VPRRRAQALVAKDLFGVEARLGCFYVANRIGDDPLVPCGLLGPPNHRVSRSVNESTKSFKLRYSPPISITSWHEFKAKLIIIR
jgi:hypothetical protein